MQFTRRDLVILGTFSLALAAGVVAVYLKASSGLQRSAAELPPSHAVPRTVLAIDEQSDPTARGILDSAVAPGAVPADYQAIVERRLFAPLVAVRSEGRPGAANLQPLPIPAPAVAGASQTPVKPATPTTASTPQDKPVETPATPASTPTAPPKPPIAVTGLIRTGDGYRVVVENTELNRSQVVRVGQDAFGYRISEVSAEKGEVVLGKADAADSASDVTLKLGENKKVESNDEAKPANDGKAEKKDANAGADSSTSTPPGMGGGSRGWRGFDPSQLTPEQRARFEQYRQQRGSRGGNDGWRRDR